RQTEEAPLKGAKMGGDFTLTNQDGEKITFSDFDGRYRMLYFGYTYCPDVCPIDLQQLALGLKQFEKQDPKRASNIQPVFVTVDPQRDTPDVVKQYLAAFHPRYIGLTGSEEEIAEVAKKYLVLYEKTEPNEEGGYLVSHTQMAVLFGKQGEPIAILPHDGTPQEIAAELDRWTR
uniref:SCO family protein n=1 Tax=Sphingorhabdus sp. Alg239-R122 TaxID=2305989 RepID=UPI0013DB6E60